MMLKRQVTVFVIGLFVACVGCGSSGNPGDLSSDLDSGGQVDAHDSAVDQDAPDVAVLLDVRDSGDVADVFVDVADVAILDARDAAPDDSVADEMMFDVPLDEDLGGGKDVVEVDQLDTTDAMESDASDGFGAEDLTDIPGDSVADDILADTISNCTAVTAHILCWGYGDFVGPFDGKVYKPGEESLLAAHLDYYCFPYFLFTVPDLSQATVVVVTENVIASCDQFWTVTEPELCGDTLSAVAECQVDPSCMAGFLAVTFVQFDARAAKFARKP